MRLRFQWNDWFDTKSKCLGLGVRYARNEHNRHYWHHIWIDLGIAWVNISWKAR